MRLVDVDSLYRHLFTCSDGRICPNTDIDNWPIQIDVKTIKKIIRKELIVFDIPDNATNGQIVQMMFPNVNVYEHNGGATYSVNNEYNFNATWWNAPYQKERRC